MSPLHFENKILAVKELCLAKAARLPFVIWPVFLASAVFFYFRFFYADWSHAYPNWSRFNLIQDRFWLDLWLIAFSIFGFWIPKKLRIFYLALAIIGAWLFSCYKLRSLDLSAFIFVLYFLLMFFSFKVFSGHRKLKLLSSIVLFALCAFFIGWLAVQKADYKIFQFFWMLHPEYLLLHTLFWSFLESSWIIFSPINVVIPLPLPPESRLAFDKDEKIFCFLNGLVNLLVAVVIFGMIMRFMNEKSFFENIFLQNMYAYFIFLSCVVAGFNMAQALLRLYLIRVPDATYFVFLSKSPLELWSRGSVYIYRFFMQAIYLPIYRKTRSVGLTLAFCFAATFVNLFLFHDIALRSLFRFLLPNMNIANIEYSRFFLSSFVWLLCWAFLGATFYYLRKNFWRGQASFDWVCIVTTHLLASQITFAAGLVSEKILHQFF